MKYLRFGIYILLVFFLFSPFLILPRIIKVKKIECYNQYGLCSNDFLARVNPVQGSTFTIAKKKIAEEFQNTKIIDNYSFRFKLPFTLRIDFILKKAKYAIQNKNTKEIMLIDSKGMVLEKTDKTNLPYIIVTDDLADSKKTFALELIYSLYYLYQVKTGEVINDSLEVNIPEGGKIIFPLEGERDILLGSMKLILSRLNTSTNSPKIGKVKEIDLRYKNPVIRYE